MGASGIAKGKKIVNRIGGGEHLQKDYPKLLVQDGSTVTYGVHEKFLPFNGNLASYVSTLNLVGKMTSSEYRTFSEPYLYVDRLQNREAGY